MIQSVRATRHRRIPCPKMRHNLFVFRDRGCQDSLTWSNLKLRQGYLSITSKSKKVTDKFCWIKGLLNENHLQRTLKTNALSAAIFICKPLVSPTFLAQLLKITGVSTMKKKKKPRP